MRILIDISDKDYEKLKDGHIPFSILDVMQNGTPIPDNATNGDVIKAMFPNARVYKCENFVEFWYSDWYSEAENGRHVKFRTSWWDTPYQKGGK